MAPSFFCSRLGSIGWQLRFQILATVRNQPARWLAAAELRPDFRFRGACA